MPSPTPCSRPARRSLLLTIRTADRDRTAAAEVNFRGRGRRFEPVTARKRTPCSNGLGLPCAPRTTTTPWGVTLSREWDGLRGPTEETVIADLAAVVVQVRTREGELVEVLQVGPTGTIVLGQDSV